MNVNYWVDVEVDLMGLSFSYRVKALLTRVLEFWFSLAQHVRAGLYILRYAELNREVFAIVITIVG